MSKKIAVIINYTNIHDVDEEQHDRYDRLEERKHSTVPRLHELEGRINANFDASWDEFFHEIYCNAEQQQAENLALLTDIAIFLAYKIGTKKATVILPTFGRPSQSIQKITTMSATDCYVYRIGIHRSEEVPSYELLCYIDGAVKNYSFCMEEIATLKKSIIRTNVVTSEASYSKAIHEFPKEHCAQLLTLSRQLQATVDKKDELAFINGFNEKTSFRIAERLSYPVYKASKVDNTLVCQAVIAKEYPMLKLCDQRLDAAMSSLWATANTFAKIKDKNKLKPRCFSDFRLYEARLTMAKEQIDTIFKRLNSIVDKKASSASQLQLLKMRYIWVIQEAARCYYFILRQQAMHKSFKVEERFNSKFRPFVQMNELYRIKFIDMSGFSLEKIATIYNHLLAESRGLFKRKTRSFDLLKTQMQHVYDNSADITDKPFSLAKETGKIYKENEFQQFVDMANPTVIKNLYDNEVNEIAENLLQLNTFINISAVSLQAVAVANGIFEDFFRDVQSKIADFLREAQEVVQEEAANLLNNECEEKKLSNARRVQVSKNDSQKEIINIIDEILNLRQWWHGQLRGCYSGVNVEGITVPNGVAAMLQIRARTIHSNDTLVNLQQYKAVVKARIGKPTFASFFGTRMKNHTGRFYQLIDQLDVTNIKLADYAGFANFLASMQETPPKHLSILIPQSDSQDITASPSPSPTIL